MNSSKIWYAFRKGLTLVSVGEKKKFSSRYIQHKMINWFIKYGGFKIQADVSTD
jgi:hypothetical protein